MRKRKYVYTYITMSALTLAAVFGLSRPSHDFVISQSDSHVTAKHGIVVPAVNLTNETYFEKFSRQLQNDNHSEVVTFPEKMSSDELVKTAEDSKNEAIVDAVFVADQFAQRADRIDLAMSYLGQPVDSIDGQTPDITSFYDHQHHSVKTTSKLRHLDELDAKDFDVDPVPLVSQKSLLKEFDGDPKAVGSSGSLALAFSTWLDNSNMHLSNKVKIAMTGDVNSKGQIKGVMGVRTKVKTLIDKDHVDLIVVSTENQKEAEEAAKGQTPILAVDNFASLLDGLENVIK